MPCCDVTRVSWETWPGVHLLMGAMSLQAQVAFLLNNFLPGLSGIFQSLSDHNQGKECNKKPSTYGDLGETA